MENEPLVSVIIPTYNGQNHIKEAVKSVLEQIYQNIEIIIINDGSFDKTSDIIFDLAKKEKRIKILENKKNLGFVRSLNLAIKNSNGKYMARLDDDDLWIDKIKLKKQVNFLENNFDYVLVGGGVISKKPDEDEEIIRYLSPQTDKDARRVLLIDNVFAHSSVVFLKSAFEKVKGYNEKYGFFADWDLWLKMGILGKLYNFQEYFVIYTDKEGGHKKYFSRDKQIRRKLFLRISMLWQYRRNYGGILKSILYCCGSYLYSFLPLKNKMRTILFKARIKILGTPYKYEK